MHYRFFFYLLVLLLHFSLLLTSINAQSTLPVTWYNNNSITNTFIFGNSGSQLRSILTTTKKSPGFSLGFYCIGDCRSYAFSVVVTGGGDPGVVWSANRDRLVGENAKLELTGDGDLVLNDADGTRVWSTNTSGSSVADMNITELGNLVLFNNKRATVWQSFDHPTDTLLVGQRLYEGQKLISGLSATNWSRGIYYATFSRASGFAAYTNVGQNQSHMYYQLNPEQNLVNNGTPNSTDPSNYEHLLKGGFFVNWGAFQGSIRSSPPQLQSNSLIEYTKLDSDGHLKIYRHSSEIGMSWVVDIVAQDLGECQYPRQCGEFGFCSDGQCSCPMGFHLKSNGGGCYRVDPFMCPSTFEQKAQLYELFNASYFDTINTESAIPGIKDLEGCKQACMQNCSCEAVFFKYESNVTNGYCYAPSEVLTIRQGQIPNHNFTSASFIKHQQKGEVINMQLTIRIALPILGFLSLTVFCGLMVVLMQRITKIDKKEGYFSNVPGMPVRFSLEDLKAATEGFKVRIGGGGFGSVFKGRLRNGTEVAVKRLDNLGEGVREFMAEVETIGSLHHFNLVRLIGFCAEKSHRLLVYEYLSNGSLERWIFNGDGKDKDQDKPFLDWETRKKITLDVAKGLAYLHEECRQRIIHLDIKPQNILLDENFNAKISDFGLSKLINREESQVLTSLRGTPGYIAPECGNSRITVKVDIYSYGIVLLEIVSGRRNLDRARSDSSKHLLGLLQRSAEENRLIDILKDLDEESPDIMAEALRLIRIGVWCLQNDPEKRPIMSTVVKVLEGVMEVDPDICYKFTHAMKSPPPAHDVCFSAAPQASVLSNPR